MKMDPFTNTANSPEPENKKYQNEGAGMALATCKYSSDLTSLSYRALHRFLLDMVSLVYEVEISHLVSKTRGRKKTAFARQVAMYLAHTAGGLSLTAVGGMFGRDRTTVAHGCALIEDARDEPGFDRSLAHLESAIACQLEMFRHSDRICNHYRGANRGTVA